MVRFNTHIIPKKKGAFIVGGSIRDILAQRIPSDYDFVVLDNPKQFAMDIGERTNGHVVTLGKPGLTLYRVMSSQGVFDVSPASGATIFEDLSKRDFTVNAMAVDLNSEELIDPFNGREDLQNKRIRMVSEQAFKDDPIRLLRAFRLGALFDFQLEPVTRQAVRTHEARIVHSAGERIHAELVKILETHHSFGYVNDMVETGLLFRIFPELKDLPSCPQNRHHDFNVFDHTLAAYGHMESILNSLDEYVPDEFISRLRLPYNIGLLKYSILLHDIGKPGSRSEKDGFIHFYGHEILGAKMAGEICTRLKFSGYEKKYTRFVIKNHLYPLFLFSDHGPETILKKARTKYFMLCGDYSPDIALHAYADFLAKKNAQNLPEQKAFKYFVIDLIHDYFTAYVPVKKEKRVLTGNDLIREFDMKPSPYFRTILDRVEESRLSGQIQSRNEALSMVRHILEIGNNHSSS